MPETILKNLPIALTEEEQIRFGQQTGHAVEELSEMKETAKISAAVHKDRIKEQEKKVYRLSHIVSSGIEWRSIECEVLKDYGAGKVSVVRCDTGEVLEERRMTKDEQQMTLEAMAD